MSQDLKTWLIGAAAIVGAGVLFGVLFLGKASDSVPSVSPADAKGYFGELPKVAENAANAVTAEKVALGKMLFFDPRLSKSAAIACNSCHGLASGGSDRLPTSIGHTGQIGGRNAPTVLNAALNLAQFWDGRAADVEEQAGKAVLNPVEMASTEDLVLARLRSIPDYVDRFRAAFAGDAEPLNYTNATRAIAAFERTLLTPSRFDRYLSGDSGALSADEVDGLGKFVALGCVSCHSGPAIGGGSFQKFGKVRRPDGIKDAGRFAVTHKEEDRYVFKVPTLRNIALTAPYFHDGSVWTLEEAVQIMADTQLGRKLRLADAAHIARFLESLNADPPLQVILPSLPASTAATPRPQLS